MSMHVSYHVKPEDTVVEGTINEKASPWPNTTLRVENNKQSTSLTIFFSTYLEQHQSPVIKKMIDELTVLYEKHLEWEGPEG